MTKIRQSVSARLRGLELPESFAAATVAAEARTLAKRPQDRTRGEVNDLRRLRDKARRLDVSGLPARHYRVTWLPGSAGPFAVEEFRPEADPWRRWVIVAPNYATHAEAKRVADSWGVRL
jgi:hypothetical protein